MSECFIGPAAIVVICAITNVESLSDATVTRLLLFPQLHKRVDQVNCVDEIWYVKWSKELRFVTYTTKSTILNIPSLLTTLLPAISTKQVAAILIIVTNRQHFSLPNSPEQKPRV